MNWMTNADTQGLNDVDLFIHQAVNGPAGLKMFSPDHEIIITRAPGRIDIMGGIADYSGSPVLELPMMEATLVAFQRQDEPTICIDTADRDRQSSACVPLADLARQGKPISYAEAQAYFKKDAAHSWTAYIVGAWLVLMHEKGIRFEVGARLLIRSDVPEGKGVSSSAALEVATMQAICCAYNIVLEPHELALLCQKVENLIVGAACGIMDQMTVACGEQGRALALLCQPHKIEGQVTLPPEIEFWGIDSGIRHAISGSDYTSVRIGAFMGYRMIAEQAGLHMKSGEPLQFEDPRWNGYLANINPSEFDARYRSILPRSIQGRDFLQRYRATTDPVTKVDPARTYAVQIPAAHPVHESFRVRTFIELLDGVMTEQRLSLLGELMYSSHESYSACGLGSTGTDWLVEMVREAGPERGLYGAKITGGGSGGTVAVLAAAGAHAAIEEIALRYEKATGHKPFIFNGSSPGAVQFGCISVKLRESKV